MQFRRIFCAKKFLVIKELENVFNLAVKNTRLYNNYENEVTVYPINDYKYFKPNWPDSVS